MILRQQLLTHPNDPVLYELYARASNTAGDEVRAEEAIAESYYLRGNIHEAVLQLQKISEMEGLDYYERARITDRLNELRMELSKLASTNELYLAPTARCNRFVTYGPIMVTQE